MSDSGVLCRSLGATGTVQGNATGRGAPGTTSATCEHLRNANSGSTPDLQNQEVYGGPPHPPPQELLMLLDVEKHWYWVHSRLWGQTQSSVRTGLLLTEI